MTPQQMILLTCLYSAILIAVAFFTRPTARRIGGAFAGGAADGLVALGLVLLGEAAGWWRVGLAWEAGELALLLFGLAISAAPLLLVTWRVARRFGSRGLAVLVVLFAAVGPPRDYAVSARYPEWIVFAPGVAPVLAVAATYSAMVLVGGHPVMWLVAGPSAADRLARRPWAAAEPSAARVPMTDKPPPV